MLGAVRVVKGREVAEPAIAARNEGEPSDEDLAARLAAGDRTAFTLLADRHLARTVTIARRVLMRRAEVEDVAQDVFVKLWQSPGLYNPEKSRFTTWLYRVTVNRALDVARRVRPSPLEAGFDREDGAASAIEQMVRHEQHKALAEAMAGLPERQRAALALSYEQDLADREAAIAMEISVKAYEALLVRARRTLREKLQAGGWHEP